MILIRNGERHLEWFYKLELRWTHHVSGSFANYLKRLLSKIEGKYAAIKITRYIYFSWYHWNIFAFVYRLLNRKSEKSNFVRGNHDYPLFFCSLTHENVSVQTNKVRNFFFLFLHVFSSFLDVRPFTRSPRSYSKTIKTVKNQQKKS